MIINVRTWKKAIMAYSQFLLKNSPEKTTDNFRNISSGSHPKDQLRSEPGTSLSTALLLIQQTQ
jgi:hypothetical protein